MNKSMIFSNFYSLQKYNDNQIELLSIQIGCTNKTQKVKKNISQEDLGLIIGLTNWQNLLKICQAIEVDFELLFRLNPKKIFY
ncbi:hypothetical protein HNP24_001934 [Chryseobacterium sediminis]|uniref:XRE family transcriptional regulator n=1 Tax=Chryseobacterium sediminis TaxID=1679494 RepID=A0ABR6PZH8_9FLAO|nr:hypothetical protein [Chryseobacterium sediminis]